LIAQRGVKWKYWGSVSVFLFVLISHLLCS
jgi:hypothetical protein